MIRTKNDKEITGMREAGAMANAVLLETAKIIQPGITTREIDEFAARRIEGYNGKSAFLGYKGYPCYTCISVNEEVVHGISGDRTIQFGDIISLDVGVTYQGFIGDNALTVAAGGCEVEVQNLMDVTERSLDEGISKAILGNRVVDISRAIQKHVESSGFSVVREFVGHGVGRKMHEEPQIPNFVDGSPSPKLKAGMTIAIEPMVNMGSPAVRILEDGWTVITNDRKPSAHFEHTILVTENEPEILTCATRMHSSQEASS
ncbi:MAG: type I methionyl aminopeptidase [Verrucomicrobia bacterium]|jgi:methionyl aminopeptidase|nr:type I methionyl aminopeptidase [Verrucomicrobiota bacterium]